MTDDGTGFWDWDAVFFEALTPPEKQRLADLVRRVINLVAFDVRAAGVASP